MVFPRIALDERRIKKDGTYPIVIRITLNRMTTTFRTGISVESKYWDTQCSALKKKHPNYKKLNTEIYDIYAKIQKAAQSLADEGRLSSRSLQIKLNSQLTKNVQSLSVPNFNEYATTLISDFYKINKTGNGIIYQTAVNRLLKFVNYTNLSFEQINFRLLNEFKNSLINDGVKPNTISNYFRTLRAIYNRAIKEKVIGRDYYPFLDIDFKAERTRKRAMSSDDLAKFVSLPVCLNTPEWHARNFFILSFVLIGTSFTDLAYLTPENIVNGRLTFRRRKTSKLYNIKLTPIASKVFELYKGNSQKYLLPVLPDSVKEDSQRAKTLILQWIKTTNKYLCRQAKKCGIEHLTTYVARHTWATLAKRLGYSNELIAEALGHEYGNRITAIYLDDFETFLIDDANNCVGSVITKLLVDFNN